MSRDEILFLVALLVGCAILVNSDLPFTIGLALAIGSFTVLWLVSLVLRDASIVDVFWGLGFVLVGWCYYAMADPRTLIGLVVCLMVTVWGLRLAVHIGVRNAGQGEDFRYRAWRDRAGRSFWWVSYFKIFMLQAVVLWLVSSPVLVAQTAEVQGLGLVVAGLGAVLWVFGFVFEAVADWQLMRFKADPKHRGQVLDAGLWRLSRHPNYFGESVLWWGIGLIGAAVGGWIALMGPAFLTFTLLRISGVAMLDRALIQRRIGYRAYAEKTPAFLPIHLRRRRPEPNYEDDRSRR